jgi:hypothetical protein
VFTHLCRSSVPRTSSVKTKLTAYNSNDPTACQKYLGGDRYGELSTLDKRFDYKQLWGNSFKVKLKVRAVYEVLSTP